MTKEELQNAIKVMQAYINGEEIEYTYINENKVWYLNNFPTWNWVKYKYRIKQKPKYRPFKDVNECWQEMLKHTPFGWIKCMDKTVPSKCINIASIKNEGIVINSVDFTFDVLLAHYTFVDKKPFGILDK